jgi:hypothetical protein
MQSAYVGTYFSEKFQKCNCLIFIVIQLKYRKFELFLYVDEFTL